MTEKYKNIKNGNMIKIHSIDNIVKINPNENIKSNFWNSFGNKIVEVIAILEDFIICSDGKKTFQVFYSDIDYIIYTS